MKIEIADDEIFIGAILIAFIALLILIPSCEHQERMDWLQLHQATNQVRKVEQ